VTDPPIILIVDDQPANRKLLADLLSTRGYAVVTADSGEDALAKLQTVKPDLLLLDVVMPGMNGYEVCRRIRSEAGTAVLPVVMVTALDPAEERLRGLEAGADDFLTKPINQAELLARVKSLLRIKAFHDTVQSQASELAALNAGLEQRVREQLAELQRLTQLKRFFAPHLAERIAAGDVDDPLATHRREVTVAILDLRGFTAFADTSEPEEVMSLLRRYHELMGGLIQAHGGALEQFGGASMQIIFNDPVVVEDPAARAVRMALAMQERFDELMTTWRRRGHDIALGIGIAHGYATIGAIGYTGHLGYGAIGRVTNLAARLSAEAAPGEILVSAPVFELVEPLVYAEEAAQVNLSGFARPMSTFRIQRLKPGIATKTENDWPLKIYTLGQFALVREAQPVVFSRKVQKRPLDLLKVLIAQGGLRADTASLVEALWPEAEGDAAKVSFDSNLHRLRKLLDIDDILPLSEGKLSLDRTKCWVDVWVFDDLVSRIETDAHRQPQAAQSDDAETSRELLRLYAGHFIEQESQEPWAVAARDRWRAKFVRAVTALGGRLEKRQAWDQAATLYARALELDNLAEGLYRRLMIAYRELGENAEALQVYRRCRDMLSIVLRIAPSAETEAVRATLR
jgi:DNA-binding response OmpR family regulator